MTDTTGDPLASTAVIKPTRPGSFLPSSFPALKSRLHELDVVAVAVFRIAGALLSSRLNAVATLSWMTSGLLMLSSSGPPLARLVASLLVACLLGRNCQRMARAVWKDQCEERTEDRQATILGPLMPAVTGVHRRKCT